MLLRRTSLAILWSAVLAAGFAALALVLTSDRVEGAATEARTIVSLAIGWSFSLSGLLAWYRRPHNRFGPLMASVGLSWFATVALTSADRSLPFTFGVALGPLPLAIFAHLLLAFPTGRLDTLVTRAVAIGAYATATLGQVAWMLFDEFSREQCACPFDTFPRNRFRVVESEAVGSALVAVQRIAAVILVVAVVAVLVRRWREAGTASRRALAPILWSGGVSVVLLALNIVGAQLSDPLEKATDWVWLASFASIPVAFVAGLLQTRLQRSAAVGGLVAELGAALEPRELRDALGRALGDPSLSLAYWLPDAAGYASVDGRPLSLPEEVGDRVVTPVEHDGRRVAALVHDRSLLDQPELVEAVSAAASLALEKERLQAELRARLEELRASRARIVEAGDAERRRLERNLHDGAQQRLVSLSLALRLAQAKVRSEPAAAEVLLEGAREELAHALIELRELARGIHPAVLTDRGLGPALEALAGRAPVPVEMDVSLDGRLPAVVEAAAYFVVSEAIANVAKYARASAVTVSVTRVDGLALVEVADDGVGGADPGRGSGLRGLADRVEALEGRLEVASAPGRGTRVRAEIPCVAAS